MKCPVPVIPSTMDCCVVVATDIEVVAVGDVGVVSVTTRYERKKRKAPITKRMMTTADIRVL